jgi:hypothetical protein
VAATFVTQDERKCKLQGLFLRVDGLIKYIHTLKRYVRTMLKIDNLEPQLQGSHEGLRGAGSSFSVESSHQGDVSLKSGIAQCPTRYEST